MLKWVFRSYLQGVGLLLCSFLNCHSRIWRSQIRYFIKKTSFWAKPKSDAYIYVQDLAEGQIKRNPRSKEEPQKRICRRQICRLVIIDLKGRLLLETKEDFQNRGFLQTRFSFGKSQHVYNTIDFSEGKIRNTIAYIPYLAFGQICHYIIYSYNFPYLVDFKQFNRKNSYFLNIDTHL